MLTLRYWHWIKVFAKALVFQSVLSVLLTAYAFADNESADGQKRKILYWRAPMNPSYVSDKPGKSPMGMDLVPVYEDEEQPGEQSDKKGAITVDPVVVQNMGVRTARVERGSILREVRTIGEVVVAEDKLSVVNLRFSGWVEKLFIDQTGEYVEKGQPLFEVYSPELVSAQGEYLLALKTAGKRSRLALNSKNRLLFWDLKEDDIKLIEKNREIRRTVTIRASTSGYVLKKNIVLGAYVKAGTDIYEIGDLNSIWVNAEVYEYDAPWVRAGQGVNMELSFERGHLFEGRVSYVYPTLNRHSRTLTVRTEFKNPDLRLRPGMFATIWIQVQPKQNVLKVPSEAILHSGERQLVFVTAPHGKFVAREVVTGVNGGDRQTEIVKGLKEGEEVVVSGQFLLDSESQLQEAIQKLLESGLQYKKQRDKKAVVNSAKGDMLLEDAQNHPESHSEHKHTYWTCGMHPKVVQDGPGLCPICGMDLVERSF